LKAVIQRPSVMSIHIPIAKSETGAMMRSIIAPLKPTGRLVSDA